MKNIQAIADSEALILAEEIARIYRETSPGGDGQRKAKVQCLLSDVIGNGYRRERRLEQGKVAAEQAASEAQKQLAEGRN